MMGYFKLDQPQPRIDGLEDDWEENERGETRPRRDENDGFHLYVWKELSNVDRSHHNPHRPVASHIKLRINLDETDYQALSHEHFSQMMDKLSQRSSGNEFVVSSFKLAWNEGDYRKASKTSNPRMKATGQITLYLRPSKDNNSPPFAPDAAELEVFVERLLRRLQNPAKYECDFSPLKPSLFILKTDLPLNEYCSISKDHDALGRYADSSRGKGPDKRQSLKQELKRSWFYFQWWLPSRLKVAAAIIAMGIVAIVAAYNLAQTRAAIRHINQFFSQPDVYIPTAAVGAAILLGLLIGLAYWQHRKTRHIAALNDSIPKESQRWIQARC